MKPVDVRNETWKSLRGRITGQRQAVLQAWQRHGPGTTRQIAERSGIDLLNVRPRSTELYQLGFLEMLDGQGESTFRVRETSEIMHWLEQEQSALLDDQLPLKI